MMPTARAGAATAWMAAAALAAVPVLAAGSAPGSTGGWVAPEPERSAVNPTTPSPESLARGKRLYQEKCLACHGETGEGRGPVARRLGFSAGDLTDAERMRPQTDGALFWKISTGRDPMPAFREEAGLTDPQIWDLVNFVRTLSPGASPGRGAP